MALFLPVADLCDCRPQLSMHTRSVRSFHTLPYLQYAGGAFASPVQQQCYPLHAQLSCSSTSMHTAAAAAGTPPLPVRAQSSGLHRCSSAPELLAMAAFSSGTAPVSQQHTVLSPGLHQVRRCSSNPQFFLLHAGLHAQLHATKYNYMVLQNRGAAKHRVSCMRAPHGLQHASRRSVIALHASTPHVSSWAARTSIRRHGRATWHAALGSTTYEREFW